MANHTIVVIIPAHNEERKIVKTVRSIPPHVAHKVLVINDASTDRTAEKAAAQGAHVIPTPHRVGVGAALRIGFDFAQQHGFSVIVIMAGNSKDDGSEIPRLTIPLIEGGFDFVQGSRFLPGGLPGKMPRHRYIATKYIHPLLFSLFVGKKFTDTTNGFRAFKTSLLHDQRFNLTQDWLDTYALEPYLLFNVTRFGYRVTEAAVSKIYPHHKLGYTKMRPIIDWWTILKPIFLLGLKIKK